jgi:hypothetical protein
MKFYIYLFLEIYLKKLVTIKFLKALIKDSIQYDIL